jgi:type IV pilus assembly protein PilC
MAEFVVKVADERGRVSEQIESAHTEAEARDRYSQQGFLVYSVRPRGLLGVREGGRWRLRRKVKLEQFVIFNEQFVTLIHAGLPIVQALDLLLKRQKNAFFRSILEDVRDRVRGGELLSDAFASHSVIPRLYTTNILAGEKSGNLEEVIRRYISFQRLALSFRKKLTASLIYPAVLLVLVFVMLTVLLTVVVPKFADLYAQLNAKLPDMTLFMLSVGSFLRSYFVFLIIGVLAVIVGGWYWARTDRGSRTIDRIRLKTPVLGPIWLKYQVAVFSRMLSTLLTGGLPLVQALATAGSSMQGYRIRSGVQQAEHKVREGQPLSRSLEDTKAFPSLAVEMIEVGESTGALPAMLTSVAEFHEEDVQTALTAAMSLIEPAILIFMGAIVAVVLLSLYMPIFSLGAGQFSGR